MVPHVASFPREKKIRSTSGALYLRITDHGGRTSEGDEVCDVFRRAPIPLDILSCTGRKYPALVPFLLSPDAKPVNGSGEAGRGRPAAPTTVFRRTISSPVCHDSSLTRCLTRRRPSPTSRRHGRWLRDETLVRLNGHTETFVHSDACRLRHDSWRSSHLIHQRSSHIVFFAKLLAHCPLETRPVRRLQAPHPCGFLPGRDRS